MESPRKIFVVTLRNGFRLSCTAMEFVNGGIELYSLMYNDYVATTYRFDSALLKSVRVATIKD
jgi:hypothetical protein